MFLKRSFAQIHKLSKLKKVSIPSIFHLLHFTDQDGLVHIDFAQYNRKLMIMYKESADVAINDLVKHGYFMRKEGRLYSLCHYDYSFGDNERGYHYIPTLSFLMDVKFMNQTKRQMLMLLYILHAKLEGQKHKINVENLYKNSLHSSTAGIDIFYNYEEFKKWFIGLVKKGYFVVDLVDVQATLTQSTSDPEKEFDTYCGKISGERKSRTSKYKNHPLLISVNPALLDRVNSVGHAYDLIKLAESHHHHIDPKNMAHLSGLFGVKKELYKLFGLDGVRLYRTGLKTYFSENGYRFALDCQNGARLANFFKMYYIVPLVHEQMRDFLIDSIAHYNKTNELKLSKVHNTQAQFLFDYAHDGQIFTLDTEIAKSFEQQALTFNLRYFKVECMKLSPGMKCLFNRIPVARESYLNRLDSIINQDELPQYIKEELDSIKRREQERLVKPIMQPYPNWLEDHELS